MAINAMRIAVIYVVALLSPFDHHARLPDDRLRFDVSWNSQSVFYLAVGCEENDIHKTLCQQVEKEIISYVTYTHILSLLSAPKSVRFNALDSGPYQLSYFFSSAEIILSLSS